MSADIRGSWFYSVVSLSGVVTEHGPYEGPVHAARAAATKARALARGGTEAIVSDPYQRDADDAERTPWQCEVCPASGVGRVPYFKHFRQEHAAEFVIALDEMLRHKFARAET